MDLLCNAYSNSSDEEPESVSTSRPANPILSASLKRRRTETQIAVPAVKPSFKHQQRDFSNPPMEAAIPGRYISKRERAIMESVPTRVVDQEPVSTAATSPVMGSLSDSRLPSNVLSLLRHQPKGPPIHQAQMPKKLSISLHAHTKAVNAIHWSSTHPHLLASAGFDQSVCIWNVWSNDQKKARIFNFHGAPVKDVKWSQAGLSILSCGYDCASRSVDVDKALQTRVFNEDQIVNVVKFHPKNPNLFLSGGEKGRIRLWDMRANNVVYEYTKRLGPILDLEFTNDGRQFISSSDVSRSNVSENAVMVWDVSRQVSLSNQIYGEAFTCPCIRRHPSEPYFVAQSNANYIAIVSLIPPFRLDKYKRYEGHGVSGFPIKCSFSMDGKTLATGSSEGSVNFYNSRSTEIVRKIEAYSSPCIDIDFHPTMPNVVASCSWSGDVSVFE